MVMTQKMVTVVCFIYIPKPNLQMTWMAASSAQDNVARNVQADSRARTLLTPFELRAFRPSILLHSLLGYQVFERDFLYILQLFGDAKGSLWQVSSRSG
jgi:hypothetical protein